MKRVQLCLILLLPLVLACSRQEYDIWEGVNTEMTLFEEEISAPLGSIGPITLGPFVDKLGKMEGVGELLGELLKVADDGLLKLENREALFKMNAYEVSAQLEDPDQAQACTPPSRTSASPSPTATASAAPSLTPASP